MASGQAEASAGASGPFPLSSTIDVALAGIPYQRLAAAVDALQPLVEAARGVLLPISSEYAATDGRVVLASIADARTGAGADANITVPLNSSANALTTPSVSGATAAAAAAAGGARLLQGTPSRLASTSTSPSAGPSSSVRLRLRFSAVLAATTSRIALQARLQSPPTAAALAAAMAAALRTLEATLSLPPGSASVVGTTVVVAVTGAGASSASPSSAAGVAGKASGGGLSIGVIAGAAGAGVIILLVVAGVATLLVRSRRKAAARARRPFLPVDRRYSLAPKLGDAAAARSGASSASAKLVRGKPQPADAVSDASSQQLSLAANPMYRSRAALGSPAARAAADAEEEAKARESKTGAPGRRAPKPRAPARKSTVARKQYTARPRSEDDDALVFPQSALASASAPESGFASAPAAAASFALAEDSGSATHTAADVANPMLRRPVPLATAGAAGSAGAGVGAGLNFASRRVQASAPRRHQLRTGAAGDGSNV